MGLELIVVVSLIALAGAQLVPENSCPDYFRYVNDAFQGVQGEITLPSLMRGRNRIDIRFSQRGEQDASAVGALIPYPDENAVRQLTGPAKFRIAVRPNSSNGLPKVTRLSYNEQILCSASEFVTVPPATPPPQRFDPRSQISSVVCGREGSITPFIVRGNEFPRGQYPWLSAVYHKEVRALGFKCGGSLISSSIVISAAHCVYRMTKDRVVVGLGRYDLDDYGEDGAEMRNVMRLLWHPEYNTRSHSDADIALITIERPVTFNDIIAPICMWSVEASRTVSTTGFIAGWGRDEKDSSMTQYPRVVKAEIASPTVCASTWRGTMVTERSLCAGNRDGSGPCVGDSGGGLMVKQGDRWLLRGIVSTGERGPAGTCQLNQYVLYCDLSKHLNWISENIR
ncbi:GD20441 [Drosophila simulans]|uniref:GD20441 n=1 Tax=Drosophila simulans TaxID=7240 RepID=B4R0G2_DROSI|nr:GD20441 [Drosophila simulans]